MGLDMYLNRIPKVNDLKELAVINERLDNAFLEGRLFKELATVKKDMGRIYDIEFHISSYLTTEETLNKIKADRSGWGSLVDLEIRLAYWRKFNALHNWMVENVQGGNDDCGQYIVTKEHLEKLLADLSKVSDESTAESVFPTVSGFFFGGTEYDEYYFTEIENTKATVRHLLCQQVYESVYVYQSSW